MERKQATTAVFLLLLAAIALYFCYLITKPFWGPIFLAFLLAIVFHPVHTRIQARLRNRNGAALLSTVLVLVAFLVPVVVLGIVVSRETSTLYQLLKHKSDAQAQLDLRGSMLRWLTQVSQYLLSWGAHVLSNFVAFVADALIAFFTLFFFFRDGEAIKQYLAAVLPLSHPQAVRLFTGISNSIVANVDGVLAVGATQGALAGLAFWVLGVPSPVLWALVTALFSLVPLVGSAAVWGPAAIVLAISGHWVKALILLVWGAGIVAQADNVVRPYVISERANLNTLAVFFALLGGVKAFGVIGLFVGPVALSFTLVVLEMLRETVLDSAGS